MTRWPNTEAVLQLEAAIARLEADKQRLQDEHLVRVHGAIALRDQRIAELEKEFSALQVEVAQVLGYRHALERQITIMGTLKGWN